MSEIDNVPGPTRPRRISGGPVAAPSVNMQVVRSQSGPRPAVRPDQGLTLQFVLSALRRWWMVATPISLLLAVVSAGVVYLLFKPAYEAAAWFKIEERTPFLAFETRDEGRSNTFFKTQIETIRSPMVLGPVIEPGRK